MGASGNSARVAAAAVALGLSIAGPQALGIAAADTTDPSPPSTSTDTGQGTANPARDVAAKQPGTAPRRGPRSAVSANPAAANSAGGHAGAAATETRPTAARTALGTGRSRTKISGPTTQPAAAPHAVAVTAVGTSPTAPTSVPAEPAPSPAVAGIGSAPTTSVALTVAAQSPPAALPPRATAARVTALAMPAAAAAVADVLANAVVPFQSLFEGFGLLVRRALFNKAPTVNPIQTSGQTGGPITGTVGAVDPEGDPISYKITTAPQFGSVVVATDGTYTYTPGTNFTGLDSFNVSATDGGMHINLLDPSRPKSTDAYLQVAQGTGAPRLTFSFTYGSGSQYWTPEARTALQTAATMLASYFTVQAPVNLTFDVTATKSVLSSTLASAGSDMTDSGRGFFDTVVQNKILTGVDSNGATADGTIDWNFGQPWALGNTVSWSQYDFTSTAMHEVLHTFGFLSNTARPGSNNGRNWTLFDSYIVTSTGAKPIGNDFSWNPAFNSYLTGGNGGLYFGGPQAVAIYGGPVPLYTPSPWESGSSMSHLDDTTFVGIDSQLMNATVSKGPGGRTLSPIELAMLSDLGYTVNSQPVYALLFIGVGFLRRRNRTAARAGAAA